MTKYGENTEAEADDIEEVNGDAAANEEDGAELVARLCWQIDAAADVALSSLGSGTRTMAIKSLRRSVPRAQRKLHLIADALKAIEEAGDRDD